MSFRKLGINAMPIAMRSLTPLQVLSTPSRQSIRMFSSETKSFRDIIKENRKLKLEIESIRSGAQSSLLEELKNENLELKKQLSELARKDSNSDNEKLRKEIDDLQAEMKKKPKTLVGMFQNYGAPFVLYWFSMYGASFGAIYVALANGWIGGSDAIDILRSMGIEQFYDLERLDPKYGNAAVALVMNEVLEIARFPFCVATTPALVKMFRSRKK